MTEKENRLKPEAGFGRKQAWMIIVYAALGFGLYAVALRAPFTFDDVHGILRNPAVRNLANPSALWAAFNTRFLPGLSFALNYAAGGSDPLGYHLFNVAIHVLNGVLVYGITSVFLKTPAAAGMKASRRSVAAWAAALIFLVHPIQTQAVNYIWQRTALMSAFFYLAAVFAYLQWRSACDSGMSRKWLITAAGCALAGVFCKENAVTLPLTLVFCELFCFRPRNGVSRTKRAAALIPFFVIPLLIPLMLLRPDRQDAPDFLQHTQTKFAALAGTALEAGGGEVHEDQKKTLPDLRRFYPTQVRVLSKYLRLFVFPRGQNLDHLLAPAKGFTEPAVAGAAVLLALVLAAVFWLRRRVPLAAFGLVWFFLTIAVETLVPSHNFMVEHRLYLPSFGLCAVAAGLFSAAAGRKNAMVVFVAVIISLSAATVKRNWIWADSIRLWQDAADKDIRNYRARMNYGGALHTAGRIDEAAAQYRQVIRLKPDHVKAHNNLGMCLAVKGDLEGARRHLEAAVRAMPDYALGYRNLADLAAQTGQAERAQQMYRKSIEVMPVQAEARVKLAILLVQEGKREEAVLQLEAALKTEPGDAGARRALARILIQDSDFAGAQKHFEALIRINPRDDAALVNLGNILMMNGDLKGAEVLFERAERINPGYEVQQNLALVRTRMKK